MKTKELKYILKQHKLWLDDITKGAIANLEGADLARAKLRGVNLRGANLLEVNLYRANLSGANLSEANLSEAYLSEAYLVGANLEGANLIGANLSGANLSEANLTGAYLEEASLACITGASIYTFSHSQHFAYMWNGYIRIGCECHTIAYWLANYKEIGAKAKYSKEEIKAYGAWIKSVAKLA